MQFRVEAEEEQREAEVEGAMMMIIVERLRDLNQKSDLRHSRLDFL